MRLFDYYSYLCRKQKNDAYGKLKRVFTFENIT